MPADITVEDRTEFQATVAQHRAQALIDVGINEDSDLQHKERSRVDRLALSRALVDLDYLQMRRVKRPAPKAKRRSRGDLVRRVIVHYGPPRLTYQPRARTPDPTGDSQPPALPAATPQACTDALGCKKLLATLSACDTMPKPTGASAPLVGDAAPPELAQCEQANTSWLRRCITLAIRLARVAMMSHV